MSEMQELPGMTRLSGDVQKDCVPQAPMEDCLPLVQREVILLATATITEGNVFANGLFQNVQVFQRLFEAMGQAPIMVIHEKPTSLESIPPMIRSTRMMLGEEVVRQKMKIRACIEIGMSVDARFRKFIHMQGAKIMKLYLGNILNIDIETPMFYPTMNFAHHVVGEIDSILISPHYAQHYQQACILNHTEPPAKAEEAVGPQVWDPCFLTRNGTETFQWRSPQKDEEGALICMEPNISFQKCSLIPILLAERWYRSHKGWKGKLQVGNGKRLLTVPHFQEGILPTLDLQKDGKIEFWDRKTVRDVMKEYPSATFLMHQVNNEFNQMLLELMISGFPVVHNSDAWKAFGQYQAGADVEQGAERVSEVLQFHAERKDTYRSHADTLIWRQSPQNPANHAAWETLLKKGA